MKDIEPVSRQSMKGYSQDVGIPKTDEFYTTPTEVATQLSTANNDQPFACMTRTD